MPSTARVPVVVDAATMVCFRIFIFNPTWILPTSTFRRRRAGVASLVRPWVPHDRLCDDCGQRHLCQTPRDSNRKEANRQDVQIPDGDPHQDKPQRPAQGDGARKRGPTTDGDNAACKDEAPKPPHRTVDWSGWELKTKALLFRQPLPLEQEFISKELRQVDADACCECCQCDSLHHHSSFHAE